MVTTTANTSPVQNTKPGVVIPFYVYGAVSLLAATILLLFSASAFTGHYFHPATLAITHTMALGWGTMIILGASHQLVPVMIEGRLYSSFLALLSFILAALGIPLLVYSFFRFRFDWTAQLGALMINAAIIAFLINLAVSISRSKKENVHAVFVFTASCWLLLTTLAGWLLVCNFTRSILPEDSLHYLSLHAHMGMVGWFLLLVMGVGSRLIPMFLISKYDNRKTLWRIYFLVNGALLMFMAIFFSDALDMLYLIPVAMILVALLLFAGYCRKAYRQRIRKSVDEQVKFSLLSVLMMLLPIVLLLVMLLLLVLSSRNTTLVLAYGVSVFFGWLSAIILGMTFKTLPFIVWNRIYHNKAGLGKTPNPKDLFHAGVFNKMGIAYLAGFCLFITGIISSNILVIQVSGFLLFIAAVLYNFNIMKMLLHQPVIK